VEGNTANTTTVGMPLVGIRPATPFISTSAAIYGQPQGIGPTKLYAIPQGIAHKF